MEHGAQITSTAKASCDIGADEEARSANSDALPLGTKRVWPIVIAMCIFSFELASDFTTSQQVPSFP